MISVPWCPKQKKKLLKVQSSIVLGFFLEVILLFFMKHQREREREREANGTRQMTLFVFLEPYSFLGLVERLNEG